MVHIFSDSNRISGKWFFSFLKKKVFPKVRMQLTNLEILAISIVSINEISMVNRMTQVYDKDNISKK